MMFTRKILLLTTVIIFKALSVPAQATVTSTLIEKENRNAVMIQIDQPIEITMNALEQRMKRAGLDGKTHGGGISYKAVTLSEIASEKVDIYTKVEKGENKNSSVVYMAVSKGYDNFTNSQSDSMMTERVKSFLNSFVKDVKSFSMELMITAQTDEINSAEKEYERLLSDQKDLIKKKADIESSIIEKEKEVREKKEDLEQKKQALEELKIQRTRIN